VIWVGGTIIGQGGGAVGIDPEIRWPISKLASEAGGAVMREVGLGGFGKAVGAAGTIVSGMGALADGVGAVGKYVNRVKDYMDPDGKWE